jgi:hypothetical protein
MFFLLQIRAQAEGAVFRIKRAMQQPDVAEGTMSWGRLLLTRLERSCRREMLDSELEQLVSHETMFSFTPSWLLPLAYPLPVLPL